MTKAAVLAMLIAGLAGPALAQSPFDGSWRADPASVKWPARADIYLLQGGLYTCRSCTPAFSVAADGSYHAVRGHPYFDEQLVKVLDAKSVLIAQRKAGRPVGEAVETVSPDGRKLSYSFKDLSSPSGKPVTGTGVRERVLNGPAGSHAVSGTWRQARIDGISEDALRLTLRIDRNILHLSTPTGIAFDARLGGPPVPIRGDSAGTLAAVRQLGPHTLVESDTRRGRLVSVTTMALQPDGRTMAVTFEDKVQRTTMRYVAHRQ